MTNPLRTLTLTTCTLVFLSAAPPGLAVTETWDGNTHNFGAGDSLTSNGLNWADDTAPASSLTDTDLVFAGTIKLSPIVDIAMNVRSITFNNTAGAFTFTGGTFNIGEGGIVNNDTQSMSFQTPVNFDTAAKPIINAAAGGMVFGSTVVLPAETLTVTGGFPTTFASITNITGNSGLIKEGTGTMTWAPGVAMVSDVSVKAGVLNISADGTPDVFNATSTIAVSGTGTLNFNEDATLDGAQLTRASGTTLTIAPAKTLTIKNGGDAVFSGGFSSAAKFDVSGTGSTLTTNGTLTLQSGGMLTVRAGGTGSGQMLVGPGSTASVTGTGSLLTANGLSSFAGTVNVTAGGGVAIGGSGTLSVGTVGGGAMLTVDGAGSSMAGGALVAGNGLGATGQATFRNGSAGTLTGLSAGVNGQGANGTVRIESGASVTAGTFAVADSATAGTGVVTVTGAGSNLTLTSTAAIGAAAAGSATLNVQSGGTFTSGTNQTVTVKPKGTVAITGGTFLSNGDLLLDGAQLTRDSAGGFTLGSGKTLTVQNGGDAVFTGSYNAPPGAVHLITGAGSTFSTTAQMVLDDLSVTTVSAGASLSTGTSTIAIGSGGFVDSPGNVTVDGAGSTITAANATLAMGRLTLTNTATGAVGTLTLEDGGRVSIESGSVFTVASLLMSQLTSVGGIILSSTVLNVNGGGRLTVAGSSVIGGGSAVASVNVLSNGKLHFTTGPVSVAVGGQLIMRTGGTLSGPADFSGAGVITLGGVFTPGSASGADQTTSVSLQPIATLESTGNVILEIGGLTPGTQHDQLVFTSTANPQVTWAGTLTVSLINGFVPQAGQSFKLLTFNAARDAGTFATINLPALSAGLAWQSDTLYTDGTLRIISTTGVTFAQWAATILGDPAATVTGDHDHDGIPNGIEFALALTTPVVTLHPYPDGQRLRVLFTRPLDRTGVTLKVQASSDLTNWTDLAVSVDSAPFTGPGFVSENRAHPPPDPGLVEVRDILTTPSAPRRQIRLLITLAP